MQRCQTHWLLTTFFILNPKLLHCQQNDQMTDLEGDMASLRKVIVKIEKKSILIKVILITLQLYNSYFNYLEMIK
jgi:hypothetical protein